MKKILFVGGYPPPYGGIANHLYSILPELVKKDYTVASETPSTYNKIVESPKMKNFFFKLVSFVKKNPGAFIYDYFKYYSCKLDLSFREYIKAISLALYIYSTIKREKYDMLFLYSIDVGMCLPFLKKKLPEKPINLMIFGNFYKSPSLYSKKEKFLTSVFDSCFTIMASSFYCSKSINLIIKKEYPIEIIYVGVDTQLYKPTNSNDIIKTDLNIPNDAIVILYFARMIKIMGLEFVLESINEILNINKNIYIVIAGAKGILSYKVEELSKSNPKVIYKPDVPFAQKINYFQRADFLIAPTLEFQACMGVAIKEAMACGKPVIASNSGGIPEAIEDGKQGYIIPISDGEINKPLFVRRIRELCNNRELRKNMGNNGRQRVLKLFSNETTVEKYIRIIERHELQK